MWPFSIMTISDHDIGKIQTGKSSLLIDFVQTISLILINTHALGQS